MKQLKYYYHYTLLYIAYNLQTQHDMNFVLFYFATPPKKKKNTRCFYECILLLQLLRGFAAIYAD